MQIVIMEDNAVLATSLSRLLSLLGYQVTVYADGALGEDFILKNRREIDVLILDVLLPSKDGFSVCRGLREHGVSIPILMLTSKDTTKDIVEGLGCGADDYLAKPFVFDVLHARLRALLRRPEIVLREKYEIPPDITVDLGSRLVMRGTSEVHLTPREFSILEYLLRNRGRVVSYQELYDHAFDFANIPESNTIEVHVKNLRKKLDTHHEKNHEKIIVTVRGIGYRLLGE